MKKETNKINTKAMNRVSVVMKQTDCLKVGWSFANGKATRSSGRCAVPDATIVSLSSGRDERMPVNMLQIKDKAKSECSLHLPRRFENLKLSRLSDVAAVVDDVSSFIERLSIR